MSNFGKRLKEARAQRRLTQNEVADKLGIDFTTISKYENNKSEPDNEILRELADLYEVSIDWLIGTGASSGDKEAARRRPNQIVADGVLEPLSDDEARYLLETLEMYRLLQEKRRRQAAEGRSVEQSNDAGRKTEGADGDIRA